MSDEPTFDNLTLWTADSIVLHDWLTSVDFAALPITHQAQKQALLDLLSSLERDTAAEDVTDEEVRAAQELVARDMGW